ncbi:transposase-like protein [Paraburkholderia sp. JPY158]|uniref:Transposase-like protein n=1 Tax=Paraburkholderia atlantica TaxID=2654982 RepID=A0A7W8QG36_PARAM|nr:transposase-like protein [Paraburkholderia atlantica]
MFVTLRGEPYLLWRAVDEHGTELDVLVQKRRDKAAAKRFFRRVLRSNPVPRRIVTDQLRSYPAAKSEIPELAHVKHVFVKAAARVNNRAENSLQPTRTSRTPDARLSRCASRSGVSLTVRPDPAALCFTQTSNESGKSPCRTPGTVRHMVRLDWNCLNR